MRVKREFLVLTVCGVVFLSGCSNKNVIVENSMGQENNKNIESQTVDNSTYSKPETEKNNYIENTTKVKEVNQNLEYVKSIYEKYNEVLSDKKYSLQISDDIVKEDKVYRIPILIKTKNTTSIYENNNVGRIWIYENVDGTVNKNYDVIFTDNTDNAVIKEFLKVTLMAMDKEIEEKVAEEKVRLMVESTGKSSKSNIVNEGEYKIFFKKNMWGKLSSTGDLTIYAIHNSEINKEVNKEEYKKYTVDEMKASLNWGEKSYVTVIPYTNGAPIGEVLQFQAKSSQGDEYIIYYDFNKYLQDFEIGKEYTLYGEILKPHGDTLRFRADYYEVNE